MHNDVAELEALIVRPYWDYATQFDTVNNTFWTGDASAFKPWPANALTDYTKGYNMGLQQLNDGGGNHVELTAQDSYNDVSRLHCQTGWNCWSVPSGRCKRCYYLGYSC